MYLNERHNQSENQHHSTPDQPDQLNRQNNTLDLASGFDNAASIVGGLFDLLNTPHYYDENEAEFLKAEALRRKKKKDYQYKNRL